MCDKSLTYYQASMIEQVVKIEPNTTYILSAFVNSTTTTPDKNIWRNGLLGVKDYGKPVNDVRFFLPKWHEKSLQPTTGPNCNTATVYFSKNHKDLMLIDDMQLYKVKNH